MPQLTRLLEDEVARKELLGDLERTVAKLGDGGAHENAASAVIDGVYGAKSKSNPRDSERVELG